MTTQHQKSHSEAKLDDDLRVRNARALQLVRGWLADESGYDEEVFPVLNAELEADRLSYRRRLRNDLHPAHVRHRSACSRPSKASLPAAGMSGRL